MGMFDELRCKYPLPHAAAQDLLFQTKSLDCGLELYEIREDGSLWIEEYDIEDRSDPNATGLMSIVGCMTRVNKRWVPCEITNAVNFYIDGYEYTAMFVKGKL